MSQDAKDSQPRQRKAEGFFGRLFGQCGMQHHGHETHSGSSAKSHPRPRRYSGVHPSRLPDADGAAFLANGGRPRRGTQASRATRQRRRVRRAADHHCRRLACRVRAGTQETIPLIVPRRKPDYCLNVGITWPGLIALEIKERVPAVSFKSFGAFVAGAAARAELVGDTGASAPQNWIGGFRDGKRSRPGDAARH